MLSMKHYETLEAKTKGWIILNVTKGLWADLKPVFLVSFHATTTTTEQSELTYWQHRLSVYATGFM